MRQALPHKIADKVITSIDDRDFEFIVKVGDRAADKVVNHCLEYWRSITRQRS